MIEAGWLFRIGAITTLVAGTVFLLWLGDQITRHGIGNGVVVLLIAGPILGPVSGFIRFLVNKPVAPRLGW